MKMHVASRHASLIYVLLVVFFFSASHIFAQVGGYATPFLLFSPSASQSGMAETGTAIPLRDDPFNFYFNPAQLGFSSMNNNFMAGFNPFSDTRLVIIPIADYTGHSYNCLAFQAGYNLKNLLGGIPLSVGAGFLRQYYDLGEIMLRSSDSSMFHSYESANSFSLGFGLDYFVRISAGITYKTIFSNLIPFPVSDVYTTTGKASGHAFDIGILAEVPVIDSLKISDRLNLNVSVSAGYALSNVGPELAYKNEKDPLPRVSKLGYGLTAGLDYKHRGTYINLLRLAWSSEANESMVRNDLNGYSYVAPFSSQDMLGSIFLLDPAKRSAKNKYGLSVSALETVSGYYGHESEAVAQSRIVNSDVKNDEYTTYGYSLHTKGIFKYLYNGIRDNWLDYIFSHLDLRLSHSKSEVKRFNDQGDVLSYSSGLWANYWEMGLTVYGL